MEWDPIFPAAPPLFPAAEIGLVIFANQRACVAATKTPHLILPKMPAEALFCFLIPILDSLFYPTKTPKRQFIYFS